MKRCPQCDQSYSDNNLRFCLADGSPLSELSASDEKETIVINHQNLIDEARIKFPLELFRVYALFGYETDGAKESVLWKDPMQFHRLTREQGVDFVNKYNSWKLKKRTFSRSEILDGKWIKIADSTYECSHSLELHEDGTLTERGLFSFDENDSWGGRWSLIDGVLRLNIQIYELDIVASINGLHSGVEDNGEERNAYFRVIHVK